MKLDRAPPQTPAAKADSLVKGAFDRVAAQPAPEHLVELADELEIASRSGRLKKSDAA